MTFLAVRANTVLTTTNTTWATTANAVDGAYAANSATYAVFTNTTANAVGTIELGFGTQVSSAVGASDTINTCAVVLRHLVSQAARIINVSVRMFDGATEIGSAQSITPTATVARSDTFAFSPTAAQLRSANLKIVVAATRFNGTTAGTFSIDYVDMTVNYGTIAKANFPGFTDTFDALPIDSAKWKNFFGSPTITNGQLALQEGSASYTGVTSTNQWNLINSACYIRMTPMPLGSAGRENTFGLYAGGVAAQQLIMVVLDKVPRTWLLQAKMPGNTNALNMPYDPIAHAWLRMSSVGATVTMAVSPDGVTWTTLRTFATALDMSSMSVELSAGQWSADPGGFQTAYFDNLNTLTPAPPAITGPQVVRSGRSASATTAVIDVSNGGTLFIVNNQTSTSFTANDAGVTLLHTDTGGPRRNSIWRIAPGTVGNIQFTRSAASLWAWVLVDWLPQEAFATYIGNNTTADISGGTLTVAKDARVGVFWNTNSAVDWALAPAGYTALDTVYTQVAEPSWSFAVSNAAVPAGAYTTPTYSRGKEATSAIEMISVATLLPPIVPAKISTFTDTFDTQIDPVTWPVPYRINTAAWSDGRAALTEMRSGYSSISTDYIYDLNESSAFVRVIPPTVGKASGQAIFSVRNRTNTDALSMYLYYDTGQSKWGVASRYRIGSTNDDWYSLTYDVATTSFFRVRLTGGTAYWEYGPDGVTWTVLRSQASTVNLSTVAIEFSAGQWADEGAGNQSVAYFDNVNVASSPAGSVSGRPKARVGGTWLAKPGKVNIAGQWVEKPWKRWNGTAWVKLGASPLDADTSAYLAATGLNISYASTLDALVVGLKSTGLWQKMSAIYPLIGGTADLHKWNLKDPRDFDAAYRLTYYGASSIHSTALGYRANPQGATNNGPGYADTHFVPLGTLQQDSTHLSFYSPEDTAPGDRAEMGCFNWTGTSGSRFHIIARYTGVNAFYYGMSEEGTSNVGVPAASGLFVATRTGSTTQTAYRNGVSVGTSVNGSIALPPTSVWLGAINFFQNKTDVPCGFASIGSGLDAKNVADLYTVVQAYQTALGRAI